MQSKLSDGELLESKSASSSPGNLGAAQRQPLTAERQLTDCPTPRQWALTAAHRGQAGAFRSGPHFPFNIQASFHRGRRGV